jgi:hypothetical protein
MAPFRQPLKVVRPFRMKLLPVLVALFCTTHVLAGAGRSYYLDAESGDDGRDGMTTASAWKSLTRISQTTLQGGDHILLKRGTRFRESLILKEVAGSDAAPIVVDAYGAGGLPLIDAAATGAAVQLHSCRYVQVKNLELTSDGAGHPKTQTSHHGVLLTATAETGCSHIVLQGLYIHDTFDPEAVEGRGIYSYAAKLKWLDDVTIENCRIERTCVTGIFLQAAQNVRILNNRLRDIGGPGINLVTGRQVLIRGNEVDHSGSKIDPRMHGRGSGAWTLGVADGLVERNKFMHAWGINDSCGFHFDIGNRNLIAQYNLSLDNAGGFVEILGANRNCAYRYNISINDGWRVKGRDRQGAINADKEANAKNFGYILWTSGFTVHQGRTGPFNSYIYNNTIFVKADLPATFSFGSTTDGLLIANNVFQIMGASQDVHGVQDNKQEPKGARIQNVVVENNLYNRGGIIPDQSPVRDRLPILGEAGFVHAGGLDPADYIPTAAASVKGKGVVIEKLPGDADGLKLGLQVNVDFFGNPVGATPSLGAIEPGYAAKTR